jgi:hypothetical protein
MTLTLTELHADGVAVVHAELAELMGPVMADPSLGITCPLPADPYPSLQALHKLTANTDQVMLVARDERQVFRGLSQVEDGLTVMRWGLNATLMAHAAAMLGWKVARGETYVQEFPAWPGHVIRDIMLDLAVPGGPWDPRTYGDLDRGGLTMDDLHAQYRVIVTPHAGGYTWMAELT